LKEKQNDWATEDMIYLQDYEAEKNREILGVRLIDASTKLLVGRFKVSNLLEKVRWSNIQVLFALEKTC
jgi:hypothetical protein